MSEASKTPFHDLLDPFIIDGTGTSHSYLSFARNDDAILAIKFGSPMDGKAFGVKGCTYIGGRIRSQKITQTIKDHLDQDNADAGNVTTLQKKTASWSEPWPDVKFEKEDSTRASSQTGAFVRGNLKVDPDALLGQFEDGTVATKFADFLIKSCGGPDHLLFSRDDLVGFIQEVYGPPAKQMRASIAAEKQVMEAASSSENIGVFGFQAALMKELFEEKLTDHGPSPKEQAIEDTGEEHDQALSPGAQAGQDSEPEEESPEDDQ